MSFYQDLSLSNSIETWLINQFPKKFGPAANRSHDLVYLPTGQLVEVKAERRASDTPNLFVEVVANDIKNTPGGPFRALADGIAFVIYIHVKCKTMYVFETKKLVDEVAKLVDTGDYKQHKIYNKHYNTLGFALPKEKLVHLCIKI